MSSSSTKGDQPKHTEERPNINMQEEEKIVEVQIGVQGEELSDSQQKSYAGHAQ